MHKSKLTLLVDGNWLLMSRLAVLNNKYANDEELVKELNLLMIKSMNIVLKTFPSIDNIIFISDGGSWRNNISNVPNFLKSEGVEYKGNREKSDDINWDLIFDGFERFTNYIQTSGITVCKRFGIEGDDWCWYWSNKLNNENTNVIIWSRDKDLTQLVKRNSDGCFTVCWNKDTGVTVIDKEEETMDFFFNMMYSENDIIYNEILNKSSNITKINPNAVVVDKIIRGDAGDNILPIIIRKSKNAASNRVFRVSGKDIDNDLNINSDIEVKKYLNAILNTKAYQGRVDRTLDEIIEHFNYNKKLVYLDESSYPQEILDDMNEFIDYNCSKNITEASEMIQSERNQLTSILDEL